MIKLHTQAVTTDGSGDATATIQNAAGLVYQIRYVPGASPLDTLSDLTITDATTGMNVLVMSNIGTSAFTRSPRILSANPENGTEGTNSDLIAVHGDLSLVIAQGGASKSGTFYIWIHE